MAQDDRTTIAATIRCLPPHRERRMEREKADSRGHGPAPVVNSGEEKSESGERVIVVLAVDTTTLMERGCSGHFC